MSPRPHRVGGGDLPALRLRLPAGGGPEGLPLGADEPLQGPRQRGHVRHSLLPRRVRARRAVPARPAKSTSSAKMGEHYYL
eukprot:300724-Prorocentrum_minimum.AAC.1